MKFYCEDKETVLRELNASSDGLTSAEAEKRLAENGKNKLVEAKKESLIVRFFKQLAEPMTIILLVAAAISAGVEIYNGLQHGFEFPADVVIILAVVLINAILGVLQECGLNFGRVYSELPTLNDVFLEITGTALRDSE